MRMMLLMMMVIMMMKAEMRPKTTDASSDIPVCFLINQSRLHPSNFKIMKNQMQSVSQSFIILSTAVLT